MASPGARDSSSSGIEACCGGCDEYGESGAEEDEDQNRELRRRFEQATQHAQTVGHTATPQQLLYLYARYKQVKFGVCTTSRPAFFDFEGRQKWEAWRALGNYSCSQAMREYIETVRVLDPEWRPTAPEDPVQEHRAIFGGPVVSCLYRAQELLRDEDKDIFDYCRENDISKISQGLATGVIDVNMTDDEGRGLLHWACDRGRTELVSLLLFHNAHINMQDDEGQTPLHYAAACEYTEIVDLLLENGADPSIKDNDGYRPHQTTDNREIKEMLKQHATFGEHDKPPSLFKSAK